MAGLLRGTGARARCAAGALLLVCTVAGAAGCSNNSKSPSNVQSRAASAASAVASAASSAASSLASQGASALASASAEAKRKLDEVKNGIDATGDVHLGVPTPADGGRSSVQVTAHNTAGSAKSFAVQVNFRDSGGNLLDTTVVTVGNVGSGKDGTATARSNRKLTGTIRAEVGRAVRY